MVVGGGSTQLVYENLAGLDQATYRLKTDLVIDRRVAGVSINCLMGPQTVSCADQSAHDWLKTDHFCVLNAATVFAANPFTRIQ